MAISPELDLIREKLAFLESRVLGILLFGSYVVGKQFDRSDIDICIVAPEIKRHSEVFIQVLQVLKQTKADVRFFELMPLYLKMAVIKNHQVLFSRNDCQLYEYFYRFRKIWKDQQHRQLLTTEELLALIREQAGSQSV